MRIALGDEGYVGTFPIALSILAESEGKVPADFDTLVEISGNGDDVREVVDENTVLEAMPDHLQFLPHE
jgi:hypothetical protein